MKRIVVTCDQQLATLKNVKTDILHFQEMWDIHPFQGPVIDAETVIFDDCNKNFVFYWAIPRVLPTAKYVYLFSHPCEPDVFGTLNRMGTTIYLKDCWGRYARQWAPTMVKEGRIKLMGQLEIKKFLESLD
jgi:hypothetical protein